MKGKVNEIRISYIDQKTKESNYKITSSQSVSNLVFEHWDEETIALQETFKIILLNNANKVKGIYELSSGGITGTLVDIRILFAVVLKSLSTAIILIHNHPSGNLKPSYPDKRAY